jgi:hypothetical protein
LFEFAAVTVYFWSVMRPFIGLVIGGLMLSCMTAPAGTGKVIKVLPQFMDREDRQSLTPSLYDRDAYQAQLRLHPEQRSGICYNVRCKTKGPFYEPLKLRVELRGIAHGDLPGQLTIEHAIEPASFLGRWTEIYLRGKEYEDFGEVTAWRVTLWEGDHFLSEQRSFLW